jgi:hypothetical protein
MIQPFKRMKIEKLNISSNSRAEFQSPRPVTRKQYEKVIANTKVLDEEEILLWSQNYLASKTSKNTVINESDLLLWSQNYLANKKKYYL